MRVALVCPYDLDTPGGVQSHVLHLADALRAQGDAVRVFAPGQGRRNLPGVEVLGGTIGVRFNDSVAPIALNPVAAARTTRALEAFDPDVVHVHEPAVPMVSLAAALRGPRPIVATFHAWSDRAGVYRAARPLLQRMLVRVDRAVAVSRAAAAYHSEALGRPASWFAEIPNGVDVARFAEAEPLPDLAGDAPLVLFVGRLEPRKGLETLVHAFLKLRTTHDARLVVVGEGDERERCEALIPRGLREDVLFAGRVDQEDLPRYYHSADVFVSPALGGESFGIVLIEAMSAGVPVVASGIPGYASVIDDGRDGLLFPAGDASALATTLAGLVDTPARRKALADGARQSAERFDWPRVALQLRTLYLAAIDA